MIDSIFPLVEYTATTSSEDVPEEILQITKNLFFDTMGCILSGSSAKGINELKKSITFWGGNKQATIFSFNDKTSAPFAAFLNSAMGHANDYDDTHDGALNHGCVTLVPALLATCEALNSSNDTDTLEWTSTKKISGKEFIAALAIGLDVSNRLGMAFIPYLHVGWLPTTLWGPFGCAAACGRLLGLDIEKMYNAFGLAYSQIHANRQGLVDGVLSKRVQPGFSASAGVQAAFFAGGNITGAKNIIDGDFGLKALYSNGQIDRKYISEDIGIFFETSNVSIKPYPCCRCSHPVIDAALSLKKEHDISWQDIENGTIYLPPPSMGQIGNKFTIRDNPTVDAQFSAQYTAALAFISGWPKMDDFTKERIFSQKPIVKLASRFEVVEFEKDNSGLTPVDMTIALKNGKTFQTRIDKPKGSKSNPLSQEELLLKFSDCLDHSIKTYSENDRGKILDSIDGLLLLDDINDLIKLF
jgi:2-methylcitrate dehydratase PrpD